MYMCPALLLKAAGQGLVISHSGTIVHDWSSILDPPAQW